MFGLLTGALLGAGGGILNNALNSKQNQMNNEFQAQEAQKQRDFQLEMWNKQNEYNDPSAQRARLENAGINPYMAMGNNPSGTAGSAGTGAAAQATGRIPMQSLSGDFSSVASAIASMAQARKVASETTGTDINNMFLPQMLTGQLNQTLGNTNYRNLEVGKSGYWKSQGWNAGALDQSRERQELLNMQYAGRLTQAQETQIQLDSQAQQTLNRYMNSQQQADLFIKAQTLANMRSTGALTDAQMRSELQRAILVGAQAKGQKIDNKVAGDTANFLIQATNRANIYQKDAIGIDHRMLQKSKDMQYRQQYYETEQARKSNRLHYWNNAVNSMESISKGAGNVVGTFRTPIRGK